MSYLPASLRSAGALCASEPESWIEKLDASLRPVVPCDSWLGIGQREKAGVAASATRIANSPRPTMTRSGKKEEGDV